MLKQQIIVIFNTTNKLIHYWCQNIFPNQISYSNVLCFMFLIFFCFVLFRSLSFDYRIEFLFHYLRFHWVSYRHGDPAHINIYPSNIRTIIPVINSIVIGWIEMNYIFIGFLSIQPKKYQITEKEHKRK